MVTEPDPKAERVKARKARKAALRSVIRTDGIVAAAKFFLAGQRDATPVSDECEDCLALNRSAA